MAAAAPARPTADGRQPPRSARGRRGAQPDVAVERGRRPTHLSAKFCNFLAGSFSPVSKRNFGRKYAFDNIFQNLQDVHTSAPLQTQHFSKIRLKDQKFQQNFELSVI